MSKQKVCKFYRLISAGDQYKLCDGKRCNYSEHVAWQWKSITCKDCIAKKPKSTITK